MAQISSTYNDIGYATDRTMEIINDTFKNSLSGVDFLEKHIEGGLSKWAQDVDAFKEKYEFQTEFNQINPAGVLELQPELYVRLAMGLINHARSQGEFEQLTDEEFTSLKQEFIDNPENFQSAKRREISIKYDKEMNERLEIENWTKRQWQHRAGIIK